MHWRIALCWQILPPIKIFNTRVSVCIKRYRSTFDSCVVSWSLMTLLHPWTSDNVTFLVVSVLCTFPDVFLVRLKIRRNEWHFKFKYECKMTDIFRQIEKDSYRLRQTGIDGDEQKHTYMYCRDIYAYIYA